MAVPANIILGDGVFSIGSSSATATAIALTRGGGSFTIEREFRQIEADGDYGPVFQRIRLVKETAKLKLKGLEIVGSAMDTYYPCMNLTASTTTTTISSRGFTSNISSADYSFAQWAGYTKGGKAVVITVENAINLENMEWELIDKEEVIQELNYSATYLETARNTAPWKILYDV